MVVLNLKTLFPEKFFFPFDYLSEMSSVVFRGQGWLSVMGNWLNKWLSMIVAKPEHFKNYILRQILIESYKPIKIWRDFTKT